MGLFYGVYTNSVSGVYKNWDEVKAIISTRNLARYRKFKTEEEAWEFVTNKGQTKNSICMQLGIEPPKLRDAVSNNSANSIVCDKNANSIVCYTDGSCKNNGKRNSVGGYAVFFPNYPELNFASKLEGVATNNRAEIMGVITAFNKVNVIDPMQIKRLNIYTDSEFVINSATKWLSSWEKNGWKKSDKTPVLNRDLFEQLSVLLKSRPNRFTHVRAHTGGNDIHSVNNAIVDKMANCY